MRGRSAQHCSGVQHRFTVLMEKISGEIESAVTARSAEQN